MKSYSWTNFEQKSFGMRTPTQLQKGVLVDLPGAQVGQDGVVLEAEGPLLVLDKRLGNVLLLLHQSFGLQVQLFQTRQSLPESLDALHGLVFRVVYQGCHGRLEVRQELLVHLLDGPVALIGQGFQTPVGISRADPLEQGHLAHKGMI